MDKIKEKLNSLRTEADAANLRATNLDAELKNVEAALNSRGN